MKKRIGLILIICLAALLAATLVACDPDATNPLGPEDPTISTYTVTFDINGADITSEAVPKPITGVKYGDTIAEPKLPDGSSIVLQKRGYTFDGWTVNNTEFKFGETKIVGNTTIKAKFTANKYYHIPDIYATLKYDEATDEFTIDPYGHARFENGDPVMTTNTLKDSLGNEVKENGSTTLVPDTDVALSESAFGSDTQIYSTYNATSPSKINVPHRDKKKEDGSDDKFCFWYYMQEVKLENSEETALRPVQFTEWLKDDADTVAVRSVTYSFEEPLHLYAMFESDLPKVTLEYYEDESATQPLGSKQYELGKTVDEKDFTLDLSATASHQENFEATYWYFVYYTENENEGEDPVRNVQKFVYDKLDENGKSTVKDATSPMDAAHDDDIPSSEQNFRPVTLKLYANWVKKITISSVSDFNAQLADIVSQSLETLNSNAATAEEKAAATAALNEIATAKIVLASDLDFGGATLKPLFDEEHPFTGTIDGGIYTSSEGEDGETTTTLTGRIKISNATIAGEKDASLFGYVSGTIKNIRVENCTFSATSTDGELKLGAIASYMSGELTGCYVSGVTFSIPNDALFAYIGGLAGRLDGSADDAKGSVDDCYVDVDNSAITLNAKGLAIGGVAGETLPSTTISNSTAKLKLGSVTATLPQGSRSGLRIGGIAGGNTATITASEAELTLSAVYANGSALIGGLAGQNAGAIARCSASLTLTADVTLGSTAPSQIALGGFIGLNEGELINSYSSIEMTTGSVKATSSLYVGGLVGLNSSSRGDSQSDQEKGVGAINRCYSKGNIKISADAEIKDAHLYVGGMIGFSKHGKFARNFTLVSIEVTYAAQNADDLIHAGFVYGELDKSAAFTSAYYANDNKIAINGKQFAPTSEVKPETGSEEEEESGETQTPEAENDGVNRYGTPRPATDFKDAGCVFGTNADEKDLGWVGGDEDTAKNIWELKEGALLPTLVNIGSTLKEA